MDEQPSTDWSDERIAAWAKARLAESAPLAGPRPPGFEPYERWAARDEVVELLIAEGFVRGRPRLRALYTELFPPPEDEPDLEDKFPELGAMFHALANGRPADRERAAHSFREIAMQAGSMASTLALGDPRTVDRLLVAASDDDAPVQEAALDALRFVVPRTRFFAPEVFERVLQVHDRSPSATVRRVAALVLAEFDDPRRWRPLAGALAEKRLPELARRTLPRAVGRGPRNAPTADARVITDRLLDLFAAEKKLDIKTLLLKSLGTIGDRVAAGRVQEVRMTGIRADVVTEALQSMAGRAVPGQPP